MHLCVGNARAKLFGKNNSSAGILCSRTWYLVSLRHLPLETTEDCVKIRSVRRRSCFNIKSKLPLSKREKEVDNPSTLRHLAEFKVSYVLLILNSIGDRTEHLLSGEADFNKDMHCLN